MTLKSQASEKDLIGVEVPQGSILGPLLFSTCINDLPAGVRSDMKLSADGVTLYFDFWLHCDN